MMSMQAGGVIAAATAQAEASVSAVLSEAMTAKAIQDFRERIQGTMGPRFRGDDSRVSWDDGAASRRRPARPQSPIGTAGAAPTRPAARDRAA
jgi:hypothetical protein